MDEEALKYAAKLREKHGLETIHDGSGGVGVAGYGYVNKTRKKKDAAWWRAYRKSKNKKLKVYEDALNKIASWGEGDEVSGRFDEPGSAQIAREALNWWQEI